MTEIHTCPVFFQVFVNRHDAPEADDFDDVGYEVDRSVSHNAPNSARQ